jgi:hypothetical protein
MRKIRILTVGVALSIPLSVAVMPATVGAKKAPVGTKTCASGVVVKANKPCPPPRFR